MSEKVLMKGNEAFAEAVIRGGVRFYFGYPITPQSEIPEFMSRELPKRGGKFLQAESELGAINMAYGCGAAGGNGFISSSSPGIALMQEGMSFLCGAEVPVTLLNVSRGGPGIGSIQPGQAATATIRSPCSRPPASRRPWTSSTRPPRWPTNTAIP